MFKTLFSALLAGTLLLGACDDNTSITENPIIAGEDCTLTQGYWKNHPSAWPVSSVELGNVTYTKQQALDILETSVSGNGLIALAHQLIAAKLNVAVGGSADGIADLIADADALIGNLVVGTDSLQTNVTSDLNDALDAFNNGLADGTTCN